jgi:hypothetical protein
MRAVVIEHVKVKDLPEIWRSQVIASPDAEVTVRIEEEHQESITDHSLFGMWEDRDDLSDVDAHVRSLRRPRFS